VVGAAVTDPEPVAADESGGLRADDAGSGGAPLLAASSPPLASSVLRAVSGPASPLALARLPLLADSLT
jgi:hypothetical protein